MDGFPIGDIIVLGAIAAFIILRYRSMLGDKSGRDPEDIAAKRKQMTEELERIIQLPNKETAASAVAEPVPTVTFDAYTPALAATLKSMSKIDPDFTPDMFLGGAKGAFEMVIDAYRERDIATLKMLLDKPLFEQFEAALNEQQAKGLKPENTLISISHAEIVDAKLEGTKATIAVKYTSDQIQLTKDGEGKVIEGNASEEVEIDDTWRFVRDLKASDPSWLIIET